MKNLAHLLLALLAAAGWSAHAATTSINLGNYQVSGTFGLDTSVGGVTGLEASAVTYARDRGTLFFVGDEGKGVIEVSRTGVALGSMAFTGWGGNSTSDGNDSEGLTYLGGGVLVVAEERFQNAYRFTYAAGTGIDLGTAPFVSVGPTIGNVGIEGISYDPRNGNFVTAKQDNPAELRIFSSLSFSTLAAPDAVPDTLFSGASSLFGLNSLSDVQTLAPVDALLGEPAADNLLLLSLDSRKLIEITRTGTILSSFDLAGVLPNNAIEGVTIDENGVIYLVAEQIQPGAGFQSQLLVLAPVPEPETWAMMVAGLGLVAAWRRKAAKRA